MPTPRRTGWLPDPHKAPGDKPDRNASEVLLSSPVPTSSNNRNLIVEVLDQGGIGSCVANAIMQAIRASHVKQGAKAAPLGSRLFAYYLSRAYHNDTGRDTGTFLRTCFAAINKFGFPPESAWPYSDDGTRFTKIPSTTAFHSAFDQRSPTIYRRIYSERSERVADIKRALAKGYLVAFGTDVSVDFASGRGLDGPIDPPVGLPLAGGHAMCIVGHDGDDFTVVNSWGTGWGDEGYCTFSADYVSWANTRDLWIVENAPRYSTDPGVNS